MAENLGTSSPILLKKKDQQGNTVLHIAASVSCGSPVSSFLCPSLVSPLRNHVLVCVCVFLLIYFPEKIAAYTLHCW